MPPAISANGTWVLSRIRRCSRGSMWTCRIGPGRAGRKLHCAVEIQGLRCDPGEPNQHIEDRMAKEAVRFLEQHQNEPFYLNYWMFSVHAPFDAKKALIEKYRRRVDPANPSAAPRMRHG